MSTGRNTWLALAALTVGGTARAASGSPVPVPAPPDPPAVVVTRGATGSYLGVGVAELTAERAKALSLKEEQGVEITRVEDDSPADKAGIKTGDVVVEYNGQRVEGVEQFMRLVRETPPGREVKLTLSRSGSLQRLALRTGSRKLYAGRLNENAIEIPRIEIPAIPMPDVPKALMSWRSSFLGIEGEALDAQLAEFFGVKEGVLVRSVIKGSSADKAGIRAGDVIVKIDDTRVASPREITAALRTSRSRKSVSITAVREKREITVTVPLDETDADNLHVAPRISHK